MTNAEKFLKDGVDVKEFNKELFKNCVTGELFNYINTTAVINWLNSESKPILSEDEKVILKNIQLYTGNPVIIRRIWDGHLQISGGCGNIDFGEYNHLFDFIKERRRI